MKKPIESRRHGTISRKTYEGAAEELQSLTLDPEKLNLRLSIDGLEDVSTKPIEYLHAIYPNKTKFIDFFGYRNELPVSIKTLDQIWSSMRKLPAMTLSLALGVTPPNLKEAQQNFHTLGQILFQDFEIIHNLWSHRDQQDLYGGTEVRNALIERLEKDPTAIIFPQDMRKKFNECHVMHPQRDMHELFADRKFVTNGEAALYLRETALLEPDVLKYESQSVFAQYVAADRIAKCLDKICKTLHVGSRGTSSPQP